MLTPNLLTKLRFRAVKGLGLRVLGFRDQCSGSKVWGRSGLVRVDMFRVQGNYSVKEGLVKVTQQGPGHPKFLYHLLSGRQNLSYSHVVSIM